MNIIVTLPAKLITKIITGEKKIEIRKRTPRHFAEVHDKVFVVEKGKRRIVMFFTIDCFIIGNGFEYLYRAYGRKFGVNKQYYDDYVRNASTISLWKIKDVYTIMPSVSLDTLDLNITAPQSFIYTQLSEEDFIRLGSSIRRRVKSVAR